MLLRKLVAGNWKMNGTLEALDELRIIAAAAEQSPGVDVAVCPPFTLIAPARLRAHGLRIGGQDCHAADSGAYTGSTSAPMLKEAGAELVIVGHSERRSDLDESDAQVRAKAEAALRHGLSAIVCVGESEAERIAGKAEEVVGRQLEGSLPDAPHGAELVVAYEPIWAIGTGRTATVEDVAAMHGFIRRNLEARFGEAGGRIRILYGGSVKPDNASALLAQPNVDGALVGGASLTASSFVPIIEAASGVEIGATLD